MKEFYDYDINYPDLVLDIVDYFSAKPGEDIMQKQIFKFCTYYPGHSIQPEIVGMICDRLCKFHQMGIVRKGSFMSTEDIYIRNPNPDIANKKDDYRLLFNSMAYGFEYIYRHYKTQVLPLVAYTKEGESIGSCFRVFDGIATAKHCLIDGGNVAIKGYSAEFLNRCPIYVSDNDDIDLAFIKTGEQLILTVDTPRTLEDVLVMGYPKVPLFIDFCTGEKATISAQAKLSLTPTRGSIAAQEKMYILNDGPKIMLVTAKIRGGNSGGPVINEAGSIVGIATGIPDGEGYSDDHVGYGMAYPITYLRDIIIDESKRTLPVEFVEFPE